MEGTMNKKWPEVKLGDILTERRKTPDPAAIAGGQIQIVSKIGFDTGRIELRNNSETNTKMITIMPGDLVLSGINAAKGAIAIYPDDEKQPVAATIHYSSYQVNPEKAFVKYLWWYLRSNTFKDVLNRHMPGGIKTELRAKRFLSLPIRLPSITEQKSILSVIEKIALRLTEATRIQKSINETLSCLIMSLHFSLSNNRQVELSQLLKLDELREPVLPNTEYPQVGIRGFGAGLFAKSATLGINTTYKYFNQLKKDQIVLSQVKGWEGAIALCTDKYTGFFASPEYRTFKCITGACDPNYMGTIIKSAWFQKLLSNATRGQGDRRERTRPELFLKIRIPMPSYEKQRKSLNILDRINTLSNIQPKSNIKVNSLMPSILDKAFKGELI